MCKTIITDIDIATAISRVLGQKVTVRVKEYKQKEEGDITKELVIYNSITKKNVYGCTVVSGDIYKKAILELISNSFSKQEDEVR